MNIYTVCNELSTSINFPGFGQKGQSLHYYFFFRLNRFDSLEFRIIMKGRSEKIVFLSSMLTSNHTTIVCFILLNFMLIAKWCIVQILPTNDQKYT